MRERGSLLRVLICGRPNVGKSTLFNRLVGKRLAIVDDTPGVTRDVREGEGRIADLAFTVIDTAGLEDTSRGIEARMSARTEEAIEHADVALFLIDARASVTPLDEHFAGLLRRRKTPVLLVANKCEGRAGAGGLGEAYALGLGDPIPVSAEHGEGMGELYDALRPFADDHDAIREGEKPETDGIAEDDGEPDVYTGPLQFAIVGRPNVGKSTLVNRLLGTERMLTGPEAGITRDAIASDWDYKGRAIRLVDTAGLRRKARVDEKVESLSAGDTLRSIRFAQVVGLVIDATDGLEKQDLTIARNVIDEGRALVLIVNKWDAVDDRARALGAIEDRLMTSLPQVRGFPVVTLSAKTGRGIERLMPAVVDIFDIWNAHVPTARLNRFLESMLESHPPPLVGGRRIKIRYMTQPKTRPPTFAVFANRADKLPESYVRYLINGLRDAFGLDGVPIRILLRKGKNPYVN
ncbi:MAG: ribosome biogenesis GTPase Der [Rhodospirillales bacterium]